MKREIVFSTFFALCLVAAIQSTSTLTPDARTSSASLSETAIPAATGTPVPTAPPNLPFAIVEDYMVLQRGNDAPAFILQTLPAQQLADNHTGIWWENYDRYQDSNHIYRNGFTRMRIGSLFDWSRDDQGWPLNADTLLPRVDDIITEYAENGTIIVLPIHHGSTVPLIIEEFTQEDIDTLLTLTSFIVEHFKGRITCYEVWNEFGNHYAVDSYVNLIVQSTELIKAIDPNARVIIGSIPGDTVYGEVGYGEFPRHIFHTTYLWSLIDAIDFHQVEIDGFSWHPFYDIIPEDDFYQDYPRVVREIQEQTAAQGFSGEYYADELLWAANDDFPGNPPFSRIIAEKYYLRAITEHRGLDVNVTINTFFQEPEVNAIRNLNTLLAGAEPLDPFAFSLEPEAAVQYLRQYAFTLPDGDLLLAVWRNGAAVEQDAGVGAILTIPDVSAQTVTGIDPYYGFEQVMVTDSAGGDLLIEHLMLKDYPIFIRID